MAEQLFSAFKTNINRPHPISEIVLLPSKGGRFEVTVDDQLIYSKAATGKHADPSLLVEEVRGLLAAEG